MRKRYVVIGKVTCGRANHFTSTLWMEGAKFAKEGFLSLSEGVVAIFADNGHDQMYAVNDLTYCPLFRFSGVPRERTKNEFIEV